ncbi:MAG: isocitrate/isopropylmalate dehydrogenase family protein [Nitrososphaerota archaeon]|nr:isocitrate/isopropylmalate dehydrogenase family protein [Nitrososphaerota archaeon]MDG6942022.1 isocitrate/isopropylmalate dehydrogenase family protein [Nitrososphaerota archaeon]MDG6942487.1 isocitrate/isopropylmalate dehydrogenase family protein [Nitrososphaerota archaeon]MDG6948274.1 isocitrate/isopropylmalate dehydrogenase family protein [Nitrososphaerota archaeon]
MSGKDEPFAESAERFRRLLQEQADRAKRIGGRVEWLDYAKLDRLVIGVIGGDGIGPIIARETKRVMERLLKDELRSGRVEIREIGGLTIENRIKQMKPLPDEVFEEIKKCHVLLKGPTTTPEEGSGMPNIESANIAIRKAFDLFANVRPVKVPSQGIDWVFFRENTEGEYVLGSKGFMATPDLAVDFKVITRPGSERIIRLAFEHAKKTGRKRVTVVTKANVIKTTDGLFLEAAKKVAGDFPGIELDSWYIDVFTAKLIDEKRRRDFEVVVLPNLYGDIVTDEAAELQGGVGTAGSANIGARFGMFEAIHGSAPRMVTEGRGGFADPLSLMRAAVMLLEHVGMREKSVKLARALDLCGLFERKMKVTGRADGATAAQFGDYVVATLSDPRLDEKWLSYQSS